MAVMAVDGMIMKASNEAVVVACGALDGVVIRQVCLALWRGLEL